MGPLGGHGVFRGTLGLEGDIGTLGGHGGFRGTWRLEGDMGGLRGTWEA